MSIKFQTTSAELIATTPDKQFVNLNQITKIEESASIYNNLEDLNNKELAIDNLGLRPIVNQANSLLNLNLINEELPIINQRITLSHEALSNQFIFNTVVIINPLTNEIICEDYNNMDISGVIATFKNYDVSYNSKNCLVSYIQKI